MTIAHEKSFNPELKAAQLLTDNGYSVVKAAKAMNGLNKWIRHNNPPVDIDSIWLIHP
ncbi:hypothetical protein [Vibrio ouci]|uniref:hypothetical protein n=1 Tax=Vibrio ouci TaxID=2499078 RepID=UPI00142D651C|nr:hypothetical protein [Vibrio ouci]